ncbi:MAG TPA: hypothetical protein VGK47_14875 [Nitrososphaeraceae archaeon]
MVSYAIYPRYSEISAITNALNAVVTFTEDHDFTDGEIVGFRVTPAFGMFEINNRRGRVLSHTDTTITVDIDTKTWTSFDFSPLNDPGTTPPVCVPSSSGIIPNMYVATMNLEDAFDNRRT